MKYLTLLITTLLLFSPSILFAEKYDNFDYHYSLTIPEGWTKMSNKEILEIEKDANRSLPLDSSERVNYVAGFLDYQEGSGWLLIQQHDVSLSLEILEQQQLQMATELNRVESDFNLIEQGIDSEFDAFFVKGEIIDQSQNTQSITFIFPGKDITTQLNYYIPLWSYEENIDNVVNSISSFEYESGYGYQEVSTESYTTNTYQPDQSRQSEKSFLSRWWPIIIGGLIGIGIRNWVKNKKKTSKSKLYKNIF